MTASPIQLPAGGVRWRRGLAGLLHRCG